MHEQVQGSELAILPGLRHSILIEAPALVADTMADFLLGAGRARGAVAHAGAVLDRVMAAGTLKVATDAN